MSMDQGKQLRLSVNLQKIEDHRSTGYYTGLETSEQIVMLELTVP